MDKRRLVARGIVILACLGCPKLYGQTLSTDTLQEIGVRGERKQSALDQRAAAFSPGLRTVVLDSAVLRLYHQQTLATLLAEQTSVFVKSYGFNALATLNFRGASAAQSQVLWNGVPLQNAALGLADVSLLPVSLIDKVSVLYGASAGLWGSGAVGGAVLLEIDSARFERGYQRLDVSASAGSFGQLGGLIRGNVAGRKLALSVRAFGQQAENNFRVPATLFSPEEAQRNATLQAAGLLLRGALKLSDKQTLEAHGWVQQYDREIPRALFESSSVKVQQDRNLRGMLRYSRQGRVELGAKLAAFSDLLRYDDEASRTHSVNRSNQIFGEASAYWKAGKDKADFLLFTPLQASWTRRTDDSLVLQRRMALAGASKVRLFQSRLEGVLTARFEKIDGQTFFLPGMNTSFKATSWLIVRGALQRTYRAPTLNELYYTPGGNPSLKPEEGWGGEVGYTLLVAPQNGWRFRQDATVYRRDIRNWILWFGSAIWTPHNIAAVRSQGVEVDNKLTVPLSNQSRIILTVNGAFTRAQTTSSELPSDGSIGKQLPYTPKVHVNTSAGLYVRQLFISYHHGYTGQRFVTADESFSIPAFHIGNVSAMWEGDVRRHAAALLVRAANIWNAEYTVVAGRPMPGRHFLMSLRLSFL